VAAFIWPFDPAVYVTSEYGPRTGGAGTFHEGIDLAPPYGTPMPAAGAGRVERNDVHPAFGNLIILHHGTFGNVDLRTVYAHRVALSGPPVGGAVAQGDIIGEVGNSGASQGAHLHFETHVSPVGGPLVWNTSANATYRTAINPRDFMATYGDANGGGPDPQPEAPQRRRQPVWLRRPPTLGYRSW
jgi:murein DD-endopeptidase MepM/ murein hydrolase activator NlpD